MKSRTSFFNPTVFRKNLTRFAPVWGLYTVALLMCLVLLGESGVSHWLYANLGDSLILMPIANLGYALICAQLLFGDLYNSRMCNALHAMPLRRECWFGTHLISGLVFNLIPTAVMALCALIPCGWSKMVDAWQIPLYWLLGSNLQFICFFGLAVFSAFCVGNRFAQAVIYGILNFGSVIAYWLVDTLYTPLIYGVKTWFDPYQLFCPVVNMVNMRGYIDSEKILDELIYTDYGMDHLYHGEFVLGDGWRYLWICAMVGLLLMTAALLMYRKRKLESAGDFVAIAVLEPIFLVAFTMIVGCVFQFVVDDVFGLTQMPVFLVVGLAVGWFTGKMMLERQIRVFRVKNFLGLLTLMGVFALTLALAMWDPLGIETWLPETDKVQSVTVSTYHGQYHDDSITLEDPADIDVIREIHREGFTQRIDEIAWVTLEEDQDPRYEVPVTIEYRMQDGSTVTRYYYYWSHEESGKTLQSYFSRVEAVFGTENPTVDLFEGNYGNYGYYHEALRVALEGVEADRQSLLDAIVADCKAGTMAQYYAFGAGVTDLFSISLTLKLVDKETGTITTEWKNIVVDAGDANCVAWLEAQGVDVQSVITLGNG